MTATPTRKATMPSTSLDTTDATELAEMLQFISDWLDADHGPLSASMTRFVGHPAYDIGALHDHLDRFIFLLGGNDGEHLM
jgi:hypothetical protein